MYFQLDYGVTIVPLEIVTSLPKATTKPEKESSTKPTRIEENICQIFQLQNNWGEPEQAPHQHGCIAEVCVYACLFGPTAYRKFQMSAFKYFTMIACHVHDDVYFSQLSLSRENEREGLLPDCKFGVKESESEDDLVEWGGSTHGCGQLIFSSMVQL